MKLSGANLGPTLDYIALGIYNLFFSQSMNTVRLRCQLNFFHLYIYSSNITVNSADESIRERHEFYFISRGYALPFSPRINYDRLNQKLFLRR